MNIVYQNGLDTTSGGRGWRGKRVGRYEYICVTLAPDQRIHNEYTAKLEAEGWHSAWGDYTVDGAFVVYRRELPEEPKR